MSSVVSSKTIDNSGFEDQVQIIIEDYEVVDVKAEDGTELLPSYTFKDDTNTGIYRLGADNVGITTGGVRAMNFSGSVVSSNNEFRIEYLSGNPQLCFENTTGTGEANMYVDSNDDFFIQNSKVFKYINLLTSNAGRVQVKPYLPTITNVDFCVLNGNTVDYDPIFEANESNIRSRVIHNFANGSAGSPSLTFNSFPTNGMYSTASSLLGFSVGGVDKFNINTSTNSLVTSTANMLTSSNYLIDNQNGESLSLSDSNSNISITAGGSERLTVGSTLSVKDNVNVAVDLSGSTTAVGGKASLSGGTVSISNNNITTSSHVILNYENNVALSNPGHLFINGIIANTSFNINSTNASDNGKITYMIINNN